MELESLIIFLIMILIIAIPVMIINRKKKLKGIKIVQDLFDLAEKSNSKITEYDKWNDTVIGIDKASHRIFYLRKSTEETLSQEIILVDMLKCRLKNTNRVVTTKETSHKIIEKLELVFTPKEVKMPELILEFYNINYDSLSLRDEVTLAEKWTDIANLEIERLSAKN